MSLSPLLFWCFGGVLIDHIGRASAPVQTRQSNPGGARLSPGGVALNIARALSANGARVALMGAVGRDIGADLIIAALVEAGIEDQLIRTDHPTGAYLAIEDADGDLHAGVSDLTALETLSNDAVVAHLAQAPPDARLVIDANLTSDQLFKAAMRPGWLAAEAVSASKAPRLSPILPSLDALFCNLSEAAALDATLNGGASTAEVAAKNLAARTQGAVFVTDGPRPAAAALGDDVYTHTPPPAPSASVTGAGDAFTAAALMALAADPDPKPDLKIALTAAIAGAATHLERQS